MTTSEWKVPRPSGVISSRDLARNTSKPADRAEGIRAIAVDRSPRASYGGHLVDPRPAWRPRRGYEAPGCHGKGTSRLQLNKPDLIRT